jgi:hypothetical protein
VFRNANLHDKADDDTSELDWLEFKQVCQNLAYLCVHVRGKAFLL